MQGHFHSSARKMAMYRWLLATWTIAGFLVQTAGAQSTSCAPSPSAPACPPAQSCPGCWDIACYETVDTTKDCDNDGCPNTMCKVMPKRNVHGRWGWMQWKGPQCATEECWGDAGAFGGGHYNDDWQSVCHRIASPACQVFRYKLSCPPGASQPCLFASERSTSTTVVRTESSFTTVTTSVTPDVMELATIELGIQAGQEITKGRSSTFNTADSSIIALTPGTLYCHYTKSEDDLLHGPRCLQDTFVQRAFNEGEELQCSPDCDPVCPPGGAQEISCGANTANTANTAGVGDLSGGNQDLSSDSSAPCFPSSAVVTMADGTAKRVGSLKEGDTIVAATAEGELTTDTVSLLSLAKPNAKATFVTLTTASSTLSLTENHYVPVGEACCSTLKKAKDVEVDDQVWTASSGAKAAKPSPVTAKSFVASSGLHSPVLTHGGFPVVDGIVTSFDDAQTVSLAARTLKYLLPICKASGSCELFRRTFLHADRLYIDEV